MKSERVAGIPVSRGIGIGPVFLFQPYEPKRSEKKAESAAVEAEVLASGMAQAEAELTARIEKCEAGSPEAEILDAHMEILHDPCLAEDIQARIDSGVCCAASVWDAYQAMIDMLLEVEDPVFRGRATDMVDVRNRLLRCCEGLQETDFSALREPTVLVANELTPSDTISLPRDMLVAIAAETGTNTSHAAILARSWGIPAVLGVPGLVAAAQNREGAIVDAVDGAVIFDPDEETLALYAARRQNMNAEAAADAAAVRQPVVTTDGVAVATEINVGKIEDIETDAAGYADGVGLFRSEFLFMQAEQLPDEEAQYRAYSKVLKAFGERPVILRTLDIGGDKELSYFSLPKEENPFLGLRALRLCFAHEDIFRTQLRAACRASAEGNLWLMFPMVSSLDDFRRAKAILRDVQNELGAEGISCDPQMKVGIMIETPAIALMAEAAARETDFASIGTNDLCQYTCAADRMNTTVAPYNAPENPGFLRLVAQIARAYTQEGKPLGVCGELAADPRLGPVLVGMGIRSLSVNGASLGSVRRNLSGKSCADMAALSEQVLACTTIQDVKDILG